VPTTSAAHVPTASATVESASAAESASTMESAATVCESSAAEGRPNVRESVSPVVESAMHVSTVKFVSIVKSASGAEAEA
jgi:hypothetical protein